MSITQPNILFLSIDALRADHTSVFGYHRKTTPNLEKLAKNAIICDQAVSMGAHTQVSFHTFMTSSLPYSHGGYDLGAEGRPTSLIKHLHDHNYETITIATFPWVSKYLGYNDGAIDTESFTFILNAFVGLYGTGTMASALRAWHSGKISVDRANELIKDSVLKTFDHSEDYCLQRKKSDPTNKLDFKNAAFLNEGFHYDKVLKSIERHRKAYLTNPTSYIEKYLTEVPYPHNWIGREWRLFCRNPRQLIKDAWLKFSNPVLNILSPKLAALRKYKLKRYVDAGELANRVLREIKERRKSNQPFFLWTHFIDTHVPYCPGPLPNWHRHAPDYLEKLGYPRDMDISVSLGGKPETAKDWETWTALYDATVLYVDEQIGRVIDELNRIGQLENTIIVICGDHGEELGEHGDISHHFRLHEHNIRIPLIFSKPGIAPQRLDHLVTLLDIAPTLAKLVDIPPVKEWVGQDVTSARSKSRSHVLLETFHGGNCLFDQRPLYMAVRTKKWKYLWKEYIDPTDHYSPAQYELYNIGIDPLEQNNLFFPDHPEIDQFNKIILDRIKQIPEISKKRFSEISSQMNISINPVQES